MLRSLSLTNVGPAPSMELELGERLNLITGDNGLGKSFLLDAAWWALTRKWPRDVNDRLTSGYMARPRDPKKPARIAFSVDGKSKTVEYESIYSARDEAWLGKAGRPLNPGLVLYAHADGGFSVWDPARNYWKKRGNIDIQERLPAYVFSGKELWDGLSVEVDGRETIVCNGLLRDWAAWIREGGKAAANMATVLKHLSPESDEGAQMRPGPLVRVSVNEARDIPTVNLPYANAVPVIHCSAGVRRILSLGYLLLWSWNEHVVASERLGEGRTSQVVLLVDEIESHLHPRWQRTILTSLLTLINRMHFQARIQIVAATHSPLILASVETSFDENRDAWFDLDCELVKALPEVVLRKRDYVRRGDISSWLTSEAFDLKESRSLEAEKAITAAVELAKQATPKKKDVEAVERQLRAALGDTDRFWVRWTEFRKRLKVTA